MLCMDNSDYMRNADYGPNRLEAQADAVHLLCGAKTQQNAESSVGILTMAGDRIEVLVTPTTDLGQMISGLPGVTVGGDADLLRGLQVAQLALKHRQNKNQKQRIIAFVGSPVQASEKELESLAKNLKKNNVSVDLVSFGEIEENSAKLKKLLAAVNSNDMSHLLEVPAGPKLLSDALLSSAIIYPDGDAPFTGGEGGFGMGEGFDFGDDPELALALRISMEEERARQEKLQQQANAEANVEVAGGAAPAEGGGGSGGAAASGDTGGELPIATGAALAEALGAEDMDEELRAALLASLQDEESRQAAAAEPQPSAGESKSREDPQLAAPAVPEGAASADEPAVVAQEAASKGDAPAAAVAETAPATAAPAEAGSAAAKAAGAATVPDVAIDTRWFQDASFVQELLGSLPGVDINDQAVQSAIRQAQERAARPPSSGGSGPPK